MARYRPIDVRLWSDRRFLSLSAEAKLLWIFFLTTPNTLAIPGVIIGGEGTFSEQLGWSVEGYRDRLRELIEKGLKVRVEGRVVWLSNALKYQPPAGPNAIDGWAKCWDDIPESNLKGQIWDALKIACKRWSRKFEGGFPHPHRAGAYAQTSLHLDAPGSGTGSGSGSETGTGERAEPAREPQKLIALGGSWKRWMTWWTVMLETHDRLRRQHGIKPGTPDLPKSFGGINEQNIATCERHLREAGYGEAEIDLKFRHVIAVAETEARRVNHLDWFIPAKIFDPERFNRAVDTTLQAAARPRGGGGVRTRGAIAVLEDLDDPELEPQPEPQGAMA